tara:strand:- start:199 stop:423 length:225 start_codon:yes stop_codon:yes gene_type:complete
MITKQELRDENEKLLEELNTLKSVIYNTLREKDSKLVELEHLAKQYEKTINILSGRLMALYTGDAVRRIPETEE